MKEKELRLALVCYGGISLAVYMHGVVKEILKLVRASAAYHSVPDVAARQALSHDDLLPAAERARRETDTEAVYFEALKTIGRQLDLRVITDVVAGASAGGINAIFLARALAHDLPINDLRSMWLELADVTELLAPEGKARAWSKFLLKPLIWAVIRVRFRRLAPDREIREKLSTFLRSRWFRPPFDGPRLGAELHDALRDMGRDAGSDTPTDSVADIATDSPTDSVADSVTGGASAGWVASLMPTGQRLDLFVTLTDFFGYVRHIPIHDPPILAEREHRHTLRFSYQRRAGGVRFSDFDAAALPGLAFAARATSSYPGAFPPAQLREIDEILARRGQTWAGRAAFMARNFAHYARGGGDPEKTSFVDGSVLNDKPFEQAIAAIGERPAYRQVDRRLVYIDPDPAGPPPPPDGQVPGFLRTLKDVISDIPRNEPVYDDLAQVDQLNRSARRLTTIVESVRPRVVELVGSVMPGLPNSGASAADIGRWRAAADTSAAREAGFAYEGYVRLRLALVIDDVTRLIADICDVPAGSDAGGRIAAALDGWARASGVYPEAVALPRRSLWRRAAELPEWAEFLQSFDQDFRHRRLRFVIQSLNRLYAVLGDARFSGVSAERLDAIKTRFYETFETIRTVAPGRDTGVPEFAEATAALVQAVFAGDSVVGEIMSVPGGVADGARTADALRENGGALGRIDPVIGRLAQDLDLDAADRALDQLFADFSTEPDLGAVRDELMLSYVGFAFWDVLTFPIAQREGGNFNEIRVDRISPDDCRAIREGGAAAMLKGVDFNHFGAFFSRRHRENDYLWGRLHGAERAIDLLVDAAQIEGASGALDVRSLKKRAFLAILDTEAAHLTESAELFTSLRAEIARI